jgi:hypothetical protein
VRRVAAALLHHPVHDRQRAIVTTAITNLDLHDIARSAHTFGISDLFVAHPVAAQRELAERVRAHWIDGTGARRIPDRKPAMQLLRVVESLADAVAALGGGDRVESWVTSASPGSGDQLDFESARRRLATAGPPVLLVFGTGWGLCDSVCEAASFRLAAIASPRSDGYNHLSVRAAAAIIFDRLLGVRAAG